MLQNRLFFKNIPIKNTERLHNKFFTYIRIHNFKTNKLANFVSIAPQAQAKCSKRLKQESEQTLMSHSPSAQNTDRQCDCLGQCYPKRAKKARKRSGERLPGRYTALPQQPVSLREELILRQYE